MRRLNIVYTLSCVAVAAFTLQSCKPSTGILPDNGQIIQRPYSLYFADSNGMLYSTYDGENIELYHTGGGIPMEAIMTSGLNILFKSEGRNVLHSSDGDEGKHVNFNPVRTDLNPDAFGSTQFINLIDYNDTVKGGQEKLDRIYISTVDGVFYNDSNGKAKTTWFKEAFADGTPVPKVTSFAKLQDGSLIGFDDITRIFYTKQNLKTAWGPVGAGVNLPPVGTGRIFIIPMKNDIIAVVTNSSTDAGFWVSKDKGATFTKLPDLPNSIKDISCAAAPFGKVLIACTHNNGIYRLSGQGVWEYAGFGLKNNTDVVAISEKDNIYKNDSKREFVFIATTTGMYRSDDLGQNWIRLNVPPGTGERAFTALH